MKKILKNFHSDISKNLARITPISNSAIRDASTHSRDRMHKLTSKLKLRIANEHF